jgi:hypothetical protein
LYVILLSDGLVLIVLCLLTFTFRLFDSQFLNQRIQPNLLNLLQTAEGIRKADHPDWLTGYSSPVYFMTWAKSWSVFQLQQTTFAIESHSNRTDRILGSVCITQSSTTVQRRQQSICSLFILCYQWRLGQYTKKRNQ